jgi:hypothetical protein
VGIFFGTLGSVAGVLRLRRATLGGGIVWVIGASGTLGIVTVGSGGVALLGGLGAMTGTLTWTLGCWAWTGTFTWTGIWTVTGAVGTLGGATVSTGLCHGVSFRLKCRFVFFSAGGT